MFNEAFWAVPRGQDCLLLSMYLSKRLCGSLARMASTILSLFVCCSSHTLCLEKHGLSPLVFRLSDSDPFPIRSQMMGKARGEEEGRIVKKQSLYRTLSIMFYSLTDYSTLLGNRVACTHISTNKSHYSSVVAIVNNSRSRHWTSLLPGTVYPGKNCSSCSMSLARILRGSFARMASIRLALLSCIS